MDEPFHVPQAQAYCAGDFGYWDPKITTPLGLYIVSVILKRFFIVKCSLPTLRLTPLLFLLLLPLILTRLVAFHKRQHPPGWLNPTPEAVILAMHPLVFFYGFLYYTDVPSLFMVVTTIVLAQEERHWLAALTGALSCTFRQTNIIWVMYAYAASQLTYLRYRRTGVRLYDPPVGEATMTSLPQAVLSLLSLLPDFVPAFLPYAFVLAGFGAFLVWNGGIVLGDKSNHTPALHVPQLYYLLAAATVFSWPVLLRVRDLPRKVWHRMFGSVARILCTTTLCAIICVTINLYTIHHPFLLADNRHYTFYLWRRVILVHPVVKYLLAPAYLAMGWTWWVAVGDSEVMGGTEASLLQTILIPLAAAPTLLPAPLLEPRYFVVPLVLARALLVGLGEGVAPGQGGGKEASGAGGVGGEGGAAGGDKCARDWLRLSPTASLVLEFSWYALINAATLYVFVYLPRGEIRFMW